MKVPTSGPRHQEEAKTSREDCTGSRLIFASLFSTSYYDARQATSCFAFIFILFA